MKMMKNFMMFALAFMFVFIGAQDADAFTDEAHNFSGYGEDFANCTGCHNDSDSAMMPAIGFDEGEVCASCHSDSGNDGDDNATNGDGAIEVAPAGHGDSYGQNCASCHTDQNAAEGHGTDDCAMCHEGAGTYDPAAPEHGGYHGEDDASCLGCHSAPTDEPDKADIGDCKSCHSETGGAPTPPPGHGNEMGQNCATCHENQMADAGHASNDCATCHEGAGTYDPDAGGGGGTTAPAAPPDHNTTHMGGFANNVGADNAEGGSCDSCHAVHGSEDGDYLTKDVNKDNKSQSEETCLQCHEDKVNTEGHPYKTDCASCHNIHAMSEQDTTTDYSDPVATEDCLSCHPSVSSTPGMESHTYTTNCTDCHSTEAVKPED